jgi:arsenate reductase (thioredoxin)
MPRKLNVIFICFGNSCRSQMAEGWARHLHPDTLNAFSAGIEPRRIDPLAIQVMKEAGVDISRQETHSVQAFLKQDIDYAILVCSEAAEVCPAFPAAVTLIHQPFDDPPQLTKDMSEGDGVAVYRRVRDEIRAYVAGLPELLAQTPKAMA